MAAQPGDKVIRVADRLDALDKKVNALVLCTGALVLIHLNDLRPLLESASTFVSTAARSALTYL